MWKWVFLGVAGIGVFAVKRRMAGALCRSKAIMSNKTVVITGANSGIGKATAIELAMRKARVILACRDIISAEKVLSEIKSKFADADVVVKQLDLASFASIKHFADDLIHSEPRLDVLINNAGVYQCPYSLTQDSLEMQMGVNHFGHFLLTNLLLDKLKSSAPSRVVVVSSGLGKYGSIDLENLSVAESDYSQSKAYNNSKLANNYFARELSRRTKDSGISVYCLRPGMARTNLGRHVLPNKIIRFLTWPLAWLLVKSSEEACQTVLHCSVAPELEGETGKFYGECREEEWNAASRDTDLGQRLWSKSEEITTNLIKPNRF